MHQPQNEADRKQQAERLTTMLHGKTIERIGHHRSHEFAIQFSDGTRLFIDASANGLEFSITNLPASD